MDESERKRKLKAGREKFNQYLKKKVEESKNVEVKRKGTKADEPTSLEDHSAAHSEASVSTSSVSSELVHILPHMSTSSEDDSVEELEEKTDVPENDAGNSSNSTVLQSDLKDDELTSSSALDLGCYPDTGTHDSEDDVSKLNGDIIESRLKEYTKKLQEYEDALGKRDIFISQLTESLSVTIEQRDKLQVEATKQADLLAKEIETLKLQIQNATEFLKNQKGKNGISAAELLEANNQIIALNQSCAEKTNAIEKLNHQNSYLNGRLNQLQSQLDGTVSQHSELEAELKARYNEITTISSVNSELLKSLNEVTEQHDNVVRLLRVKEEEVSQSEINRLAIERDFRESVENETRKLRDQETFLNSELERIRFDYVSQEEAFKKREIESNSFIDNLRLELETSKRLLEDIKTDSIQESQNLTEQIKDLQAKLSEWPNLMEQQLENSKRQTEAMMNEMKMSHQMEVDNLKETILTLNLEREHLQIRMTEAESYQSNSDLIEQLQLELQGKTLTIEQYEEKVKALESTISSYSYDVDELKIKLDQVMSEKMDIQTNLAHTEDTVKQLQLQNSTLNNLEVLFNNEKETFNDCRHQLQLKEQAYRDLEKQFEDSTKQLSDLMQLFNKASSDKVEIEVVLKSKESALEQLSVQIQSLEAIVGDERQLREQCKQELFNLNEAYRDLESHFDSQSKHMRELQIVSDQITSEKLELETKLRLNEDNLEQLNVVIANHRTLESAWNDEKQMFENYKIEIEMQLKTSNDVIENLRLENSQLDVLKTELETKKQLLESVQKELTYLDDKHQSLLFESEKQKQRADELQSHLDQSIMEEQLTITRFNELKAEYDRLQRSNVVSCAEVQVDLDDQVKWKELYDQVLQEKVKLEIELQTNQLDTGITRESTYLCGADSTDEQADKRTHIQFVAAEETESDLPEVPRTKYEGFMDKFIKIVDQLINQIEIEKDTDLHDIVNSLRGLRGHMVTFVSVDVLQKELAMAVDQQEMQSINIKKVHPLGIADSDTQKKRIEELEASLEQMIREKVQAMENYNELKSELEHLKIGQVSMKEETAVSWAEVQVDLDDQVKWKEMYDQLLEEKVELEMELQSRPIDIGATHENIYLYGPDVNMDATDGHEVRRSNSKSMAEKSETFAASARYKSHLSKLLEIVDQLLNKVEIENNWDFEFVIHELHDLREHMINMESVDALQKELEIVVDQQEMENIHIRKFQPLGNVDVMFHAEVQTDLDDQLRWKEKYDQLLQEKIELEIELRASRTHPNVAHTIPNILVTDFTDEHLYNQVVRQVADSDEKSKTISRDDSESCLDELMKTVDNLIRMTESEQELDCRFIANELHVLREHMVKFVSIGVLQKELENAVNQQEMESIKIKTVQPLGTDDVGDLVKRIEELEVSLEQAIDEKQQVTAKYLEMKSEFERLHIENESANELPFLSGSEVQTYLDDQVNWKEKYDQLLQEKVELEISLQTTQPAIEISRELDSADFNAILAGGHGVERFSSHHEPEEVKQLATPKCNSRINNSLEIVNQLLNKVENEESLDINYVVHNLQDLRHHLLTIGSVENLQNELANAIDQQEASSFQIKTFQPLGSNEDTAILLQQIEELKTSLEEAIREKHEISAKYDDLQTKFGQLKSSQVDVDDQVNWKEKYNQLLQEKIELELAVQTTESDTGITRRSAYVCGSDFDSKSIYEHDENQPNIQSIAESARSSSIEFTRINYESQMHKILKTVDQILNSVQNEKFLDLHLVVRDLSVLRELVVTVISVDVLQKELENAVDQQEMRNIEIKVVQPLGSVDTTDGHSPQRSDDLISCECNEVVGSRNDISECSKVDEVFSNQSQVGDGDELLKLKQKIGDLEHQLGEKENDLVRIRQELEAKYEEDVEHVRECLETSLALEVQADVEAELQRDKQKLEQSLGGGEIVSLDDVHMDFDDVQNLLALGASSKSDKWDAMSENSDDSKMSNGHARRLLSYLLGVYVNIGKTVNKELIHLIGTDLGVCDVTMAGDKSIQFPDWMTAEDVGESEASFISSIGEEGASDNLYENLVLEAGSKLNVAVQRLLGMLSALVQQLQEPHRSSSATNDESQILLDERNEDLVAQLTAEARSKDFLGAELNKTSDLLKATEEEKISLREELARKEKQLSEMTCQLEETKAQSQKLEECLAEEGIRPPKDLVTDGLGDSGQILRSIPVENQCSQLADDGTELLDENARLHREKRGLQHRVERERSELTARIRELEQALEETSAAQDRRLEIKNQEISDLQQQIDALEKQLRGYKHFIEEQTLEREQERDDFQRELNKLQDVSREKDRAQSSEERLSREVETWQEQLKEKNELYKQLFEKKEQLEKEVEILVEKSNSDQDVIRDLERQLDCKSRSEKMLNEQMEKLQLELTHTSRVHNDQSMEIEQLRKLSASSQLSVSTAFYEEYFGGGHLDLENPPTPESIVLELRSQVQHLEEKVGRHSLDLEGLLVVTSCLSSPCSEEVSVREQLEVLREREKEAKSKSETTEPLVGAFIKDVRRLDDKVDTLSRSKDIVLKKLKDYEAQIVKQRQAEEELLQDRDMLQQKVNAQLLQITSLQERIGKRRFGFEDDEIADRFLELQEELGKERQSADCKTKQIEELQECVTELQQQCNAYKKQVSELMQRYNSDVNLHKQTQLAASVELTETKQRSEILKNDLLKTQKQLEDVSSLLQSVMTEKNKEIDMMSTETQILEKDNEELKRTVENLETKISNALKTQQQLSLANENITKLTQDALEKDTKLNETERELKKCVEIMEQKRREVEALKVVLEEKAQLVEQVATLRTELVDLTHYQARLQEDFDTVQSMLEDRQLELGVAQQEVSELNVFKETAVEEKVQLLHEVEILKQRLEVPKIDFEVQVETNAGDKVKMEEQELKIKSLLVELEDSLSLKEELSERLKIEEKKVLSLNKKLKAVKNQLEDSEENVKQLSAELEKSNGDLKQTKDELNQSLQLKSRLEAEIAWRDTKIFRIEDELEQLKTNKSDVEGNAGKASLYKFLEEVRQEVIRESGNLTRSERTADSSDGFLEPLRTDVKECGRRGDGRQSISPGISASSSDVESVSSEPLPVPVRSLMRKVYKEGIHVLNLSELNAVEEHVPTDAPVEDLNRTMKQKNWENEKGHLVAEIEALKELLTHVTNVAAASRSVDSQLSAIPELLHSILKLLSNDRTTILEQLIGSHKTTNLKGDKLEKCVSELIAMYTNLSQTIQNVVLNLKRGSFIQNDPNSIAWEVQMAVAKERLLNQSEQKKLLNQLQTLEQQLGLRERQLKRQAELLEFRVQQEQLISEDLRRNLDMEKSRCIELCSQLALEKGRAAHMDMNIAQLKSDLTTAQMALEQEKQELFTTMQQLKNEKSTVESFVNALQSERANFTQLQEAMEAEKRRSKSSCQRDQQIKEELRQALITERDKQLELTTLLEAERIALQNARQELLRAQNKSSQSSFHFDKRLSAMSPKGSVEDINSTLAFEKMKTVDLAAALQKEQHKVNILTASLQQDRKQLLDELDSVKDTCTRLQSKLEISEVQKSNVLKEVQRNREEVHRLELENERVGSELSISQNYVCQRDQELEQLRRLHREMNKDWDIERELARQKLQEMKFEISKLEQKVTSFEKEKEMIKRGENLIDGGFVFGQPQQNKQHFMQSLRTDTGLSRIQCTSLENLRQRIFLLTLKIRDNVSKYLLSDMPAEVNFEKFSFSVKSIITELDAFGQELQMPLQTEEGLGVHLELMEKVVKHNAELAEFALRLSEDKLSLRETLMREKNELDSLKWAQGTPGVHSLPSNAGILSAERASWAQERTRLQQALHKAESDLVRVSSRQSRVTSPAAVDQVDDAKVIWQKYLRAESFRKNLVFQKTYLLLVLAGYQYTESGTLEMLGRLGCLTNPRSSGRNEYRHSKAFQRFRSAARLVGAIYRMKFLVRRWRRHDGSFLHTCGTPIYENYNDRFSMTSSISYTPSGHSQSHRFSLNSGYTPPVMDAPKRVSVDERSSVCRNLPFATANLSSSGSSNYSVNGRLSEYVRRFESIQNQLGIVVKDSKAAEK